MSNRTKRFTNTKHSIGFEAGDSWFRADNIPSEGVMIDKAYMGPEMYLSPKHAMMLADKLREWARANERAEKAKKARRK
jgi:peptidyl-tRNA hydrolase